MFMLGTPYAVEINSPPLAESSTVYKVKWEIISTGGLPIIEYEFKYKRVSTKTICSSFIFPQVYNKNFRPVFKLDVFNFEK